MTEQEAKAQILMAATAVFAQKGFAKASMNDIVRASGLSKGGVYWHFKSKDAIVIAIFDQFFLAQLVMLDEVLASEGTAVSKLQQLAKFTGDDVEKMIAQFPSPLEFYALATREEMLTETLHNHFETYQEKISTLIAHGIAAGEFRSQNGQDVAITIIALIEGLMLVWAVTPEAIDLSHQVETAVSLLLNGLLK